MLLALRSLWELINATAAITEAADSLVSTTTVLVSTTAAITEAADSVAATATVLVSTSAAITEAADSVVSTATVLVSASAVITEAADSAAATATGSVSATAAITEAADSVTATVTVADTASEASTEADDALTATATVASASTGTGCFILLANGSSKLLAANGSDHLLLFDCVVTPATTEDPGGDYSLIPLYRRRKKKLEDELEELALRLRDIAIDIPLPGHSFPVIYNRPLISPFIEAKQQQTLNTLISRAKAEAQYQARVKREQDDDDEAAILLLWP